MRFGRKKQQKVQTVVIDMDEGGECVADLTVPTHLIIKKVTTCPCGRECRIRAGVTIGDIDVSIPDVDAFRRSFVQKVINS